MQRYESVKVQKYDKNNSLGESIFMQSVFKRSNKRKLFLSGCLCFILLLFLTIFTGCEKEESISTPEVTSPDLIYQGWDLFEDSEYQLALDTFLEAIELDVELTDGSRMYAYSGAGWSCGKIPNRINDARTYFELSVVDEIILLDALGGWIFVEYQSGEWETAILMSKSLLESQPAWRFYHEKTLDYQDILLIMALSYYNLGEYNLSLETIILHFNSSFEADISTSAGRRELLEELERLSEVYG
jgi:tetratricopeptide (TPR) repeat protein